MSNPAQWWDKCLCTVCTSSSNIDVLQVDYSLKLHAIGRNPGEHRVKWREQRYNMQTAAKKKTLVWSRIQTCDRLVVRPNGEKTNELLSISGSLFFNNPAVEKHNKTECVDPSTEAETGACHFDLFSLKALLWLALVTDIWSRHEPQ